MKDITYLLVKDLNVQKNKLDCTSTANTTGGEINIILKKLTVLFLNRLTYRI